MKPELMHNRSQAIVSPPLPNLPAPMIGAIATERIRPVRECFRAADGVCPATILIPRSATAPVSGDGSG